ncbi:hypothetical protein HanHA300_Chr08g0292511 [Helianthus annuus]|nr:hypothetical protein HanHA300_Chr08g0292511 [Helianthus annuus]KAJ0554686.1 hypothetical protein HanHA89_Chr08g0310991 [Helianthus annuus]KAJ0720249.1 hypothetical protein HanLR1_Chr08g0291281 [Helianthus annuus]
MELSSKVIFISCRKTIIRMKMMLCTEIGIALSKWVIICMKEAQKKQFGSVFKMSGLPMMPWQHG